MDKCDITLNEKIKTTNLETATTKFLNLNRQYEIYTGKKHKRSHNYVVESSSGSTYEGDIVRNEYSIEGEVEEKCLNFEKALKMFDSFEFQYLQVAAQLEAPLLHFGLPVDVSCKYLSNGKCFTELGKEEWAKHAQKLIAQYQNGDSKNLGIYNNLYEFFKAERKDIIGADRERIIWAIHGLEDLNNARNSVKKGDFESACVEILKASLKLKTLEGFNWQLQRLMGKGLQERAKNAVRDSNHSLDEGDRANIQALADTVTCEFPNKSKLERCRLIAMRFNSQFPDAKKELTEQKVYEYQKNRHGKKGWLNLPDKV